MPPRLETSPPPERAQRFLSLVSPYTGLVRGTVETVAAQDDARLVQVHCETADCSPLTGLRGPVAGAGAGRTRESASVAAIAEVAERYSGQWTGDADAVLATAAELGAGAVSPERFALFSDRQLAAPRFPYAPFTRETRVAWVRGAALPELEPVWLPAQLVYLDWPLLPGEARIARVTSSGLAAHATFVEAVAAGLFELVERDAFMITWGARLSWPQLDRTGGDRLDRFWQRYVEPTGLEVSAMDMSRIWDVPCVLAVARSAVPGEAPVGVGAAAGPTIERVLEKAVDEAIRVRSWARWLRRRGGTAGAPPEAARITHFEEHVAYYAYEETARRTSFLDAGRAQTPIASIRPLPESATEQIETLCGRLRAAGAAAYCVDVAAPDVRAAGVAVARVVAPELCQLDVEHAHRYLGGRRRYEVPAELGLRPGRLAERDLNRDPHPFP